jgi:hypothetical protein
MKSNLFFLIAVGVGIVWLGVGADLYAGLTNHWKLDETSGAAAAADSEGGLHATLQGNAGFVLDAERGGPVLALDGSGDYANNSGEPFTSDGNHTVAVWVNHFDSGTLQQRWISWGAVGGRYFLGPYNSGKVSAGIGSSTTFAFTNADAKPVEDTWQHWAFVREGTSSRLYLNGNLVQPLTGSATGAISTSGQLAIGRQYNAAEYLHGLLDDLAIWNEPLTPTQIQNAMDYGAENYLSPPPEPAPALQLAYRETFYNDTGVDVADPNGTVTGWHAHYGDGTRDTDALLAWYYGHTPLMPAVNSNQQYDPDDRGYFLPVNQRASDYLFWTDEYAIDPVFDDLEAMQWSIRSSATGMHAAVRVGSDWFATAEEYDVAVSGSVWETRFFDNLTDSDWYALDFTEDSSLALTSTLYSGLPAGKITAFGAYFESTQRLRLDDFEVFTESTGVIPEPAGTVGMMLLAAMGCGLWHRRRRSRG